MSSVPSGSTSGPHDWRPVDAGSAHPAGADAPGVGATGAPQHPPVGQQPPAGPGAPPVAPRRDIGADLSISLRWTWDAFSRNVAAFLVPGIVYGLVVLLLMGGGFVIMMAGMLHDLSSAMDDPEAMPGMGGMSGMWIGYGLMIALSPVVALVTAVWGSGAMRATSVIHEGRRPGIGQSFAGPGRVLLTTLLVTAAIVVGSFFFSLPGIAASVACMYAIPAAMRGAGPLEAIRESAQLVWRNLGVSILGLLVGGAITSMASVLVVTFVLAPPISALFTWALYQRVSGRQLTEPARPGSAGA